jgi:hypothetical protein
MLSFRQNRRETAGFFLSRGFFCRKGAGKLNLRDESCHGYHGSIPKREELMRNVLIFAGLTLLLPTLARADTGHCVGFADSCEMVGASACQMQMGCYMGPPSYECTGSAYACEQFTFKEFCQQQRGCIWQTGPSRR